MINIVLVAILTQSVSPTILCCANPAGMNNKWGRSKIYIPLRHIERLQGAWLEAKGVFTSDFSTSIGRKKILVELGGIEPPTS